MKRTIGMFLFIVIWTLTSFAQQQDSERFARVINRLVEAMNKHDYSAIVKEYDAGMATAFPLSNTTLLFKNYESQYGIVTKVDAPQVKTVDQAVCTIFFERGAQDLTLYINDQEKIKGFIFTVHVVTQSQPAQEPQAQRTPATTQTTNQNQVVESKPVPAQTTPAPSSTAPTPTTNPAVKQPVAPVVLDKQQTELYPPFNGAWTVIAGGESRESSAQNNLLQQQYAYEFSAIDIDGSRYKNNGKANEDYFGYGKEVLAPANGTVVEAIDGIRENSPGLRNPYASIGNTIIIQHSSREYSVLSFLKQGSVRVKTGDKVTRGQVIAQCGSSGNAIEPKIHYHLQDSPYLQTAKSIKFYFERVMVTKGDKKELSLIHLPGIGETININIE
jgi:murein DD-endopeptidase MepM/ murein hydrolase activator NlpD